MKLNDENKQVKEFSDQNWLGFGVHKVQIAETGLTEKGGKECVEIGVVGENGEEDSAIVWFSSDKAANYSFNVLRQIYVHNAPENKKDAARDTIDAVATTEELVDKLQEKLLGGECWFTKYPNPNRTYTANDGSVKQSIDKNVYGYEPKLKPELLPKDGQSAADKHFPGAKPAEGADADGIPQSW